MPRMRRPLLEEHSNDPEALISLIFVGAAVQKFTGKVAPDWLQKFTGKVAPNWDRWGYSRQFMYATGIAELVALALFWWPGLELVGAAGLGLVLLGALGNADQAPRRTVPCCPAGADAAPGDGAVVPSRSHDMDERRDACGD